MKEESRIEVARLAMQLTVELIRDRHGHLGRLVNATDLPRNTSPLALFDHIHAHLSETLAVE